MPDFCISNIITYGFHVDNIYINTVIGYGIIIEWNIISQIGLMSKFKHNILKCYVTTVPMKKLGCK